MLRRPPRSTLSDPLLPVTTLVRSIRGRAQGTRRRLEQRRRHERTAAPAARHRPAFQDRPEGPARRAGQAVDRVEERRAGAAEGGATDRQGRQGRDRKSVGEGKSVADRVDLGGRRIIKKKTKT